MSRHIWYETVRATLVIPALLVLAACGSSSTTGARPTATVPPTATTPPTCASALPGAAAIDLQQQGFIYPVVFPQGTVGTATQQTASGPGLFTVYSFTACTPDTTTAAVAAFFSSHLGALQHGWLDAQTFPADGGLMQTCEGTSCWFDPKGGLLYYLTFDQYSAQGDVVTYRARWAVSPDFPVCGPNFNITAAVRDTYFLPGYTPPLPLPPLSSTVSDDASGGLRGYDICSPGTAQSVSGFMAKELPATGWSKIATDPACFYSSQCWKNGSAVISWDAGSAPQNWHIAWHAVLT